MERFSALKLRNQFYQFVKEGREKTRKKHGVSEFANNENMNKKIKEE